MSVNNTNNGEVVIDGILEIKSGARLTINSGVTVKFGENSKLIIEENADLILKGKLTSKGCYQNCYDEIVCENTWLGIEVQGNTEEHQYTVNGYRSQGKVIATNTATIENAKIAIKLYGPDEKINSGGIAYCFGTQFINNKVGIDFYKFENKYPFAYPPEYTDKPRNYSATFSDCDFIINSSYPHESNFSAHVNMYGVNGPRFLGCTFANYSQPIEEENRSSYGYGVYSIDSRFEVLPKIVGNTYPGTYQRTQFKNLGVGISAYSIYQDIRSPFTVDQADFDNCMVGIDANFILGASITSNTFTLGNPPYENGAYDQVGIELKRTLNFLNLEENQFTRVGTSPELKTIGISISNVGTNNNAIRKNTFNSLDVGIQASGKCVNNNSGIYYLCNEHNNNTQYDFLVCDNEFTPLDQIRKRQFELNDNDVMIATGNIFSNSGSESDRDFSNQTAQELEYYYKINGGITEISDEYSGIEDILPTDENTCPSTYCTPPCMTGIEISEAKTEFRRLKQAFLQATSYYDNLSTWTSQSQRDQALDSVIIYRHKMDEKGKIIMLHMMNDTLTYDIDTTRYWMNKMEQFQTSLSLAFDYLNSNHSQGASLLSQLFSSTTDQQKVDEISASQVVYTILSNSSVFNLSETEILQLDSIAYGNTIYASGKARNILEIIGYEFQDETCEISSEPRVATTTDNHTDVLIYPNPTHGSFTLHRSDASMEERFVLMNISGQKLLEIKVLSGIQDRSIYLEKMKAGIYFYELGGDDTETRRGKIILTD